MHKAILIFVVSSAAVIFPPHAWAEEANEPSESGWDRFKAMIEIDGYVENETAVRFHAPYQFSKVQNMVELEITGHFAHWIDIYLMGRAMYDARYDLYPDVIPNRVRNEYRSNFTSSYVFDQTLREAYVDLFFDFVDIRIGKQQVVWGEAIGLRITDVINPTDFREFILDDFIDSRIPLWMVKADFYVKNWTFELLWIPFFEPHRRALPGSQWEWTFDQPDLPDGIELVTNDPEEPDLAVQSEAGVRIKTLLGGWNLGLSYFYGWDDLPARKASFDTESFTLTFDQNYQRLHTVGFTFSNAFGPFVPQGEIALNIGKRYATEDRDDPDALVTKNFLYYMIGSDINFSDYMINIQFIQRAIFAYNKFIYEDELQNFVSFFFQGRVLRETLFPALLIIFSLDDASWLIRPSIAYDLVPALTVSMGADIFVGPEVSFIGQFDNNDRFFIEMKYSF